MLWKGIHRHKSLINLINVCKVSARNSSSEKLFVEPASSLVTEPVSIWGHNFQPFESVTIEATLNCPVEKFSFASKGHFVTSENGNFNLWDTESIGGTYTGIDSMGLFKSLVPQGDSYNRVQKINASVPLEYDFKIFRGHMNELSDSSELIDAVTVNRFYAGESVTRVPVKSGNIRGTMFIPEGDGPFPAVITLCGGNKMRSVVEDMAGIISNHGFVTLALAYFGVDDLVKNYTSEPIKIEYCEQAVQFLQSHKQVDSNAIGVIGESKGGELCLAIISHLPQVKALVGINACVASIGTTTEYQGVSTEMLPGDLSKVEVMPDGLLNIKDALLNPRDHPNCMHQFERSLADVLLIAGKDDYNWNSYLFADIAKENMDRMGKKNYEIVKYEGLGHFVDAPFTPTCTAFTHPLAPKGLQVYFGGARTNDYLEKMWKRVIEFFNGSLKN